MTFTPAALDRSHDARRRSWVASANDPASDFPLQNLPLGMFTAKGETAHATARAGIAIGDQILDLNAAVAEGLLPGAAARSVAATADGTLNGLMALGHEASGALRLAVSDLLDGAPTASSTQARALASRLLLPQAQATMHLPSRIGGFTDFLTSVDHIRRARGKTHPDDAVPVNLRHMPLAYNSRASSVRASGHHVVRPHGQFRTPAGAVQFGPCSALDFELELGAYVGPGNALGERIALTDAPRHLFGYCLLNDWSARDIQRWETHPLGPFLGKSFCSVVSPWVVTAQALTPFLCAPPPRPTDQPDPLAYLQAASNEAAGAIDIRVEAWISSAAMREQGMPALCITQSRFADMYWTFPQMVTHHACGGCDLRPGDLIGSGTISGPDPGSCGCLAEFPHPLALPDGSQRPWLADGDEMTFKARASREGFASIGFGECRSRIAPALT